MTLEGGWNQEKGTRTMSQEVHCICAQRTVKDLHVFPNPYSQELSVSPHTQAMGYFSVTHTKGQKAALGIQKVKDLQGAGYFTVQQTKPSYTK